MLDTTVHDVKCIHRSLRIAATTIGEEARISLDTCEDSYHLRCTCLCLLMSARKYGTYCGQAPQNKLMNECRKICFQLKFWQGVARIGHPPLTISKMRSNPDNSEQLEPYLLDSFIT